MLYRRSLRGDGAKIESVAAVKIAGLNPKPILTNRLVGLKPPGPVAQLVERGAYTSEYIESNTL